MSGESFGGENLPEMMSDIHAAVTSREALAGEKPKRLPHPAPAEELEGETADVDAKVVNVERAILVPPVSPPADSHAVDGLFRRRHRRFLARVTVIPPVRTPAALGGSGMADLSPFDRRGCGCLPSALLEVA